MCTPCVRSARLEQETERPEPRCYGGSGPRREPFCPLQVGRLSLAERFEFLLLLRLLGSSPWSPSFPREVAYLSQRLVPG